MRQVMTMRELHKFAAKYQSEVYQCQLICDAGIVIEEYHTVARSEDDATELFEELLEQDGISVYGGGRVVVSTRLPHPEILLSA